MDRHHIKTSASALLGASILDAGGALFGRVKEVAVLPATDSEHVEALLVRRVGGGRSQAPAVVPVGSLQRVGEGTLQLRADAPVELHLEDPDVSFLLLERDLLDQQIIDVHGHKVVRVNDVDLSWEPEKEDSSRLRLRICEVEIGPRGAMRRLLKGLPAATVEQVAKRFKPNAIPWDFVDLIDRDPSRRVKLKIEQDRLSKMHPSDLADILEELAPAERQALFSSLDEETAAEALEEVNPKLQQSLIDTLDSEQIADIVEEMDPGAAADLLSELPTERSEAILEEMEPEERREVEDLLEFAADSAAGLMTTDLIALPSTARVSDAVNALRGFEGDSEVLTDVYLVDGAGSVCGVISVVQLLFADPDRALEDLPHGHLLCCETTASANKVAELFDKYNLHSLPVVSPQKKLVGVVHGEQVITHLRQHR